MTVAARYRTRLIDRLNTRTQYSPNFSQISFIIPFFFPSFVVHLFLCLFLRYPYHSSSILSEFMSICFSPPCTTSTDTFPQTWSTKFVHIPHRPDPTSSDPQTQATYASTQICETSYGAPPPARCFGPLTRAFCSDRQAYPT